MSKIVTEIIIWCLGGKSSHVRWHLASTVVELTAIVANVVVPESVCDGVGAKDST